MPSNCKGKSGKSSAASPAVQPITPYLTINGADEGSLEILPNRPSAQPTSSAIRAKDVGPRLWFHAIALMPDHD